MVGRAFCCGSILTDVVKQKVRFDKNFDKFDIECEDTLINPQRWDDEPFELIVSNPPYSIKWEGNENPLLINDPRYAPAGVLAPQSKADMAFIMHSLSWLAPNGSAAIVCFPGIMYLGGAEQKIRKYLVDNNFVDCIIQLPSNLFFGTSIATCITVMKRGKTDAKTMFIDASNLELRSKEALIETFIAGINDIEDVMTEWQGFVAQHREADLAAIIADEKLKPTETRKFLENSFREGEVKTVGTDIDRLMPPVSRFGGGNRERKKQGIIDKLKAFFEKHFGIGGPVKFTEEQTCNYTSEGNLRMVAESDRRKKYGITPHKDNI